MDDILRPVHLIYLLLYSPTITTDFASTIYGRTRFMNMVSIFEKEIGSTLQHCVGGFDFEAYSLGPFSNKVNDAIDFLDEIDVIEMVTDTPATVSQSDIDKDVMLAKSNAENLDFQSDAYFWFEGFKLTKKGINIMKDKTKWFTWYNLSEETRKNLMNFKTVMTNTPLRNILRYIYTKYPKYSDMSFVTNRIFQEVI